MQKTAVLMFLLATLASVLGICPTECTCHNQTALCSSRWFRGIKQFTDLRELVVINTGLKSLNGSLFPSAIVMLSVRHNLMLTTIDKLAFTNLSHLKSLRISHNPDLTSIPFPLFLNNQKLTVLDLSFNDLDFLHYSTLMPLKNLVELRLQGNRFTTFDGATFSNLMNLKKLNLDYNHINSIPPNLFSAAFSIEELYLNNNNLVSLHERLFSSMMELRILDLSYNFLGTFPKNLFQSQRRLALLSLSWNYFETVPSTVSTLEVLKLDGNELHHLNSDTFTPMKSLQTLNVSSNYLLECDADLKLFLDWCRENDVQVTPKAWCRYLNTKGYMSFNAFYESNAAQVKHICILFVVLTLLLLRMGMDIFVHLYFAQRAQGGFYSLISFFRANMADSKPLKTSRTPTLVNYKQEEEGDSVEEPEYEYIDMHHVKTISVTNVNYYEVPLPQPQHRVDKYPSLKIPRKKAPSPPVNVSEYS